MTLAGAVLLFAFVARSYDSPMILWSLSRTANWVLFGLAAAGFLSAGVFFAAGFFTAFFGTAAFVCARNPLRPLSYYRSKRALPFFIPIHPLLGLFRRNRIRPAKQPA